MLTPVNAPAGPAPSDAAPTVGGKAMRVADIMTSDVVTVRPETNVREVARILLDRGISAVPVVDDDGRPLGIVSEGDLVRRTELGTGTRRSWWLDLFGDPDERAVRFAREHGRTAEQVMSRELITTTEDASLAEVARLLEKHRIKRVPVLRDGRIVGILSRANILRGFASLEEKQPVAAPAGDLEIRRAVLSNLSGAGIAAGLVDVTVSAGRVQLWGTTRSDAEERAAIVAAEEAPGVTAVESHLGRLPGYALSY
jgi:CBS domain-containing protein